MKKIIYISENVVNELSSKLKPLEDLPQDIKNVLRNHKTSLGLHPSFPPEEEYSFDYILTKKRFDELCHEVKQFNIDGFDTKSLQKRLQELMSKCKQLESNFKSKLENICYNYIIDLFKVPEGLVSFTCTLVDNVNDGKAQVKNNNELFEFNDIPHRKRLHDAVYKRRIINAIITGGALRLSVISKNLIGELYELSPELPALYKELMTLNQYMLFTKNNMGISDKSKKQSGISYLTIGNENTKNKIVAEGEIFPILLYESIRGFLEMFAAYGLPSSKSDCTYVMSKADFINAEPWDMRLGVPLWDFLMTEFDNPDNEVLPMLLTTLFSQSTDKFNKILQEILGETKLGKKYIEKILNKVNDELSYDDFDELMLKKQTDTSIISDQYYLPDEL